MLHICCSSVLNLSITTIHFVYLLVAHVTSVQRLTCNVAYFIVLFAQSFQKYLSYINKELQPLEDGFRLDRPGVMKQFVKRDAARKKLEELRSCSPDDLDEEQRTQLQADVKQALVRI
jgi:hypothetical protein